MGRDVPYTLPVPTYSGVPDTNPTQTRTSREKQLGMNKYDVI